MDHSVLSKCPLDMSRTERKYLAGYETALTDRKRGLHSPTVQPSDQGDWSDGYRYGWSVSVSVSVSA